LLSESIYEEVSVFIPVGWEKVAEVDVTVDTTTITITGLDLDASKVYHMFLKVKNPTGVPAGYALFFNGDTTLTNYYKQYILGDGTSLSGNRENNPYFLGVTAGESAFVSFVIMRPPDGLARWANRNCELKSSLLKAAIIAGCYEIAGNVTQIDVWSNQAGGIGAGSKLILFGVAP